MRPFGPGGAIEPAADKDRMRQLAVRGAGVTVFSQGLMLAIQIVALVVLARLLTPADFGVVAMVTTFSLLLVNFGLNGFTEAVVQRAQMDHALASNLFWIVVGGGLLLTAGFAAAGSFLAKFYGDPRMVLVAAGISPMIFFSSTSVMHLALLKRAMKFTTVSINDIIARIFSLFVSIVLGWAGWGYWALILGAVALPLATSLGAWFTCRWTPGIPHRVPGTGSMVRFAMNVYARFSVNYFSRNVDNLLVGWRFGASALGFYKKAYDLFALSASQAVAPISTVAVSALSRFNVRSEEYRRHLLSSISVMAFVGFALAADLTLVGKDLIRLLLGPKWESSGVIFTFFAPGIGMMILYYVHSWIHLSIGRADRWFRWGLIEVSVTCLLFLLALPWGSVGIAMAWTMSFWILTVPAFWYAGKPIGLSIVPVIGAFWKFVLASAVAGVASAELGREFPSLLAASGPTGAFVRLATTSVVFLALYLGAVILLHQGCGPLSQVARLLKEMVSRRKLSEPLPAVAVGCDPGTSETLA